MARVQLAAFVLALLLGAAGPDVHAQPAPASRPDAETSRLEAEPDVTLRRRVIGGPGASGVVLLLHGFPETLYAWEAVSRELAGEYEVHAFDWPGYGQSSRPSADRFGYAPRDYARILRAYIDKAGLDRSKLTIYATDIGALPALLAALDDPGIARAIVVGDFAPFDRPELMYESLRALKAPASAAKARQQFNRGRDEILANTFRRGLPATAQVNVSPAFRQDMAQGWDAGGMTSADAFAHYYASFTRDQRDFEQKVSRLRTRVAVLWGAEDLYVHRAMGKEFAARTGAPLTVLPGVGHYPHLQDPQAVARAIRSAAR